MLLRRVISSLAVLLGLAAQPALAAPNACSTYNDSNLGTQLLDGTTTGHVYAVSGPFETGEQMSLKLVWSNVYEDPIGSHSLTLTAVVNGLDDESVGPTILTGSGGEITLNQTAFAAPGTTLSVRVDLENGFEPVNKTVYVTVYATCTPLPDPITLSPADGSNFNGNVDASFSTNFVASGGVGPDYTYTLVDGASPTVPAGWLTINASTGELTGTPLEQGVYNFGIQVDDVGTPATAPVTQYYTLNVDPPVLVGNFFHRLYARVGESIEIAYATPTGGVPPYTYSADVSSIPNSGHTLVNGHLSVTPTTIGTFPYTLTVHDGAGRTDVLNREITVVERLPGEMWMDPAAGALTGGDAGVVYAGVDFDAHYAPDPLAGPSEPAQFAYSVSAGALPAGLVLDSSTGVVSGTPTASGVSTFTVRAETTNIPGSHSIEQAYSITIAAAVTPVTPPESVELANLQRQGSDLVAETSSGAITDMVDQAVDDAFNGNQPGFSGSSNGGQMNFVAVSKAPRARAEDALAALLPEQRKATLKAARALPGVFAYDEGAAADAVDASRWSAWAGFRVRQWDFSAAFDDLGGTQTNILGGLTYRFNPQAVAGAFAGYETFNFDNDTGSDFTGEGYTGGLYAAYRPDNGLRFNAHVAASALSYRLGVAGATGELDATRVTAGLGVSGATRLGSVLIEPSLRYTGTWETQGAYVDSLGTAHAGRTFELGKLSAGVRASRSFALDSGGTFTPFLGVFADYRYSAGDTSDVDAALDDLSGRISLGFNAAMTGNASLSLNGDVSGIGLEDAISYGLRAQFNLRF